MNNTVTITRSDTPKILDKQVEPELQFFLEDWDRQYQQEVKKIDLFNAEKTKLWTKEQKVFFIKVFYHLRGHFAEFLWYMGSFAPNKQTKELILSNILDEFNPNGLSHEQLYLLFASAFDVDLTYELLDNTSYISFAREYIDGQLRWLRDHDADSRLSAFGAIERLDNVDYVNFRDVAISIGAKKKDLIFFNVHISADHFENVLHCELKKLWSKNQSLVKDTFKFIFEYQIDMLNKFSNAIFEHS